MKKLFLFLLLGNLLLPLDAGGIKRPALKTSHPKSVAHASRISARRLQRKLLRIPRLTTTTEATPKIQAGHPASFTFQIQRFTDLDAETASAFAIQWRGKQWGVTAGHVMKAISRSPHIRIQNGPESLLFPIQKFFIGNANSNGLDLAIFEIPQEASPFIKILEPSARPPITGEKLNIPGFTDGDPFFISQEKVFMTTPAKLLLQKTMQRGLRGFCGSPILGKNNKVQAIYIGFVNKEIVPQLRWISDLPTEVIMNMPAFHMAIPVQELGRMVDMVQAGSAMKAGTMMYALGHPVGILHPNEYIMSVELFRQGEKIGKVHNNPLVDPNRLEQFFELQENDVLRITLNRPQTYEVRDAYVAYDINVSTGEVTTLTEKDLFGSPENPIIR